jgi:hypothetical protein
MGGRTFSKNGTTHNFSKMHPLFLYPRYTIGMKKKRKNRHNFLPILGIYLKMVKN